MRLKQLIAATLSDLARIKSRTLHLVWESGYRATVWLLFPLNVVLSAVLRKRLVPRSVLHVSFMGHVPHHTAEIMRAHGIGARYLALGENPHWSKCDYRLHRSKLPVVSAGREWWFFWRVMSKFEVIHCHFMKTLSPYHWELPILKRLGRRIVVHCRGCEGRDRAANMALHPDLNICQDCDYDPYICGTPENIRGRKAAREYADAILVSTPDLRDFWPDASHVPFFLPPNLPAIRDRRPWDRKRKRPFKIVHATNHPGIEGTNAISRAIAALVRDGWPIDFVNLRGVNHDRVLREFADADLAIGKMKMGYYANAQVESMALGVPTITWVRDEFMTDALRDSGFIFARLEMLRDVIEDMLRHPEKLAAKRAKARASILHLHNNAATVAQLRRLYGWETGPS